MDKIRIYTLKEARNILKVSRRSLYNFIKTGKLRASKVGREWRVSHEDLETLIK
jgi:putative molybdopterin biosynthesis protein